MRNPFILNGYVPDEYFCDRQKESADLLRLLTNGNNVVLVSPRRMGKTGLIEHCFNRSEISQNYHTFFIDVFATSNLQEFVYKLGKEIFDALKPNGRKFIEQFFSVIASLRPAFKLDEVSGAPVFDIGVGEIRSAEITLEEIFRYLNNADKPCIVAIDEFQQIARYPEKNIEAILRTHIQKTRNTTFIFSGSQRHILHNIFFSASQPFYQSAVLQSLGAIDKAEYLKFAAAHFQKANKAVEEQFISSAYDMFEGHTFYVQAVLNELFALIDDGERCNEKIFNQAVRNRVFFNENLFAEIVNLLTERQREALFAIAKEGKASNITSGEFVKKHLLRSTASVQTAVRQLLEKEIITKSDSVYSVYDRFMGLWLKAYFGNGSSMT